MRQRKAYRPPPESLGDGRYRLQQAIGAGGMATVYQVEDQETGRLAAAKLLNEVGSARTKTRSRFLAEAETMRRLVHPNIVEVYDVGEEDGIFFFVMELAKNGALSAKMRKLGTLPPRRALRLSFEALSALDHAHRNGVIHRDMKPHNILLSVDDRVKLTDFGIAMVTGEGMRITATGDMLGTIAYMAPEQRLDPRDVNETADIYSVGATLYISLTGRRPMDLAMARIDASVMERVPNPVRPVIRRAVAQRSEDRYQTARDMAKDVAVAMAAIDDGLQAETVMGCFESPDLTVVQEDKPEAFRESASGGGPSFSF